MRGVDGRVARISVAVISVVMPRIFSAASQRRKKRYEIDTTSYPPDDRYRKFDGAAEQVDGLRTCIHIDRRQTGAREC
jgi:hypothetical protein